MKEKKVIYVTGQSTERNAFKLPYCLQLVLFHSRSSLHNSEVPMLPSTVMEYLLQVSFYIFVLCVFTFCWYEWKFRAYRQFKPRHHDIGFFLKLVTKRFPKNTSITCAIFQEIIKYAKRFQEEGICVLWFIRPYVLIYSEESSKVLFNEHAIADKSFVYNMFKEFYGNGLVSSKTETWKVHRKLLNPAFYVGVLKGRMPIFNENAVELLKKLDRLVDEPTKELIHVLSGYSYCVMAESIMGINLSDEGHAKKMADFMEIVDKGSELFIGRITSPWLYWNFLLPFFESGRKYLKYEVVLRDFTKGIIEELKKSVSVSEMSEEDADCEKENRKSFAHILLEQHLKNPNFTIEDVRDHVNTFMGAGYSTISNVLMWCLYLVGRHPDVQEKAFQEVNSIKSKEVSYEDLCKLKYLECVIKETLRLYSVIPMYGRKLRSEVRCGKYKLPKDADIVFFPFMLHRNPQIFPDPERFDPERFSGKAEIRPWMFIPFAEGYRNCIGKSYSMMLVKITLAHIIRRFKITSLNQIEDSKLDWTIVIKLSKPLDMMLNHRSS